MAALQGGSIRSTSSTFGAAVGQIRWEVPATLPPDFSVIHDEVGRCFRSELLVFMQQAGQQHIREVRLRGPRRDSIQAARKDGSTLKREVFRLHPLDPQLQSLRAKLRILEGCEWRLEDLVGDDVDDKVERRLPEFGTASDLEKVREHEKRMTAKKDAGDWSVQRHIIISGEWINPANKESGENFKPAGPSWALVAKSVPTPRVPGTWYVHERQREDGRHAPWIFFNATNGQYYRPQGETGMWVQTGTPHSPVAYPLTISHSSVCVPAAGARKDDLAVSLPELARTGSLLKQPLPFLDKPAALFLLVDGLRESGAAAEFCAKRFHAQFLPRLSSRPTAWEDHELLAIIQESVDALDQMLLESLARYSGCCLAFVLVLGRRLAVCTVGDCRVLLCRPIATGSLKAADRSQAWSSQALASGDGGATKEAMDAVARRLESAKAQLDLRSGCAFRATSASEEELAAVNTVQERLLLRVARAAHPFATLGLRPEEIQAGGPAAVQKSLQEFEAVASPLKVDASRRPLAAAASARISDAAQVVEKMMGFDMYGTQLLAELLIMMDDEGGIVSQARASQLLGLDQGCGEAAAMAAVDRRYRTLLMQLSAASPAISQLVAHGIRVLEEAADLLAKPNMPWTPASRSGSVTRALGLRDFKRPRQLVGTEISAQILQLDPGPCCIAMLTDSARSISGERVGEVVGQHVGRPRAICLRLAQEATASSPTEAAGAITFFISSEDNDEDALHQRKKRRLRADGIEIGKPARARLAHVLLKFGTDKVEDKHARRLPPPGRTQADAEGELLQLLEDLLKVDPKMLKNKFAEAAVEKSDCKSALTAPLADLGWVNPGVWGKEFDASAFELEPGELSDVIITNRGAHLLYRLA